MPKVPGRGNCHHRTNLGPAICNTSARADRMSSSSSHGNCQNFLLDLPNPQAFQPPIFPPTAQKPVNIMPDKQGTVDTDSKTNSQKSLDGYDSEEEIHFANLAPALEFMCWTVVALAPFLRWVNGAAVTDDQWWIQVFLFTSALLGALSLRIYQIALFRKTNKN